MKALVEQVVLVLICSVHVTLTSKQDADQTEYAILFDVESSGTRVEINKFLVRGLSLQPIDVIQQSPSPQKVVPGISDLAADPSQVEAYLTPLLESAKKTIQ